MEIVSRLEQLREEVARAKAVPLSASCLVNRAELLDIIDAALEAVPADIARASEVLTQREALIARATDHARELVERATAKQSELVAEHSVYQRAVADGNEVREQVEVEAQAIRARADDYVDSQLANLEVALHRIGSAVTEGRERLSGRRAYDALGTGSADAVPAPSAPFDSQLDDSQHS
jgi:vacuolar-type H+-ATPase subunit H